MRHWGSSIGKPRPGSLARAGIEGIECRRKQSQAGRRAEGWFREALSGEIRREDSGALGRLPARAGRTLVLGLAAGATAGNLSSGILLALTTAAVANSWRGSAATIAAVELLASQTLAGHQRCGHKRSQHGHTENSARSLPA
jgi:hypothetical protein